MRRVRTKTIPTAIAIAVLMALGAVAAVDAAPRKAQSRVSAGPKQPRLWGDRVIYTRDDVDAGGDIWLNDIAVGTPVALPWASGLTQDQFPAIQDAVVAWKQGTQVRSRFLGRAPFTVSGASAVVNAGIRVYGNRYAWVDARDAGKGGLIYSKLVGGAEAAVSSVGRAQASPSLYGDLLVWEDWRSAHGDIYLKDFASAASPSNLTPGTAVYDQRHPSVFGTRVVWDDARLGNPDIRFFDKATMAVGTSTILTPEFSSTLTQPMAGGVGGDTHAHVATTTGLEVGDYVGVGTGSTIDYLQITAITPGQLDFSAGAQSSHTAGSSVGTFGKQVTPAIYSDANGYIAVWQDGRKSDPTLVDPLYKVRGARFDPGGSVEDTFQVPGASNALQTSPQVWGDRVVWENEAGGASIGTYELRPYAYDAGAGATETAQVLARASYAGHDAFFRYGIGSTPGAVDVSGGWSADVTMTQTPVWLIGSGSAPGSGEITVPASSIALTPGQKYYVALQANEDESYTETQTSDGFTVDTAAPPAPAAPSVAEASGKVTLSWAAVADTGGSGMDAYEIWRREGANPAIKVGEVTETAFTDDGTYGLALAPANGTTYYYSIVARDGAGNRTTGPEASAVPRQQGQLSITLSTPRVRYGTRIYATVRLTAGPPSESPTITLFQRTVVGGVETTVGTRLLNSSGVAAFTGLRPSEKVYYIARWGGTPLWAPTEASAVVRVWTNVSIRAYPSIGTRGRVSVFRGGVWPGHASRWVYLQRYYAGRWRNVRLIRLSSTSTYRILWAPNARGRLLLRAYFPDTDGRHESGERRMWYRVR